MERVTSHGTGTSPRDAVGTYPMKGSRLPRTILLISTATLFLSGCVAIYSEPSSASPTARLRIAQTARGGQTLIQELPGACQPSHSSDTGYRKVAMLAGSYT